MGSLLPDETALPKATGSSHTSPITSQDDEREETVYEDETGDDLDSGIATRKNTEEALPKGMSGEQNDYRKGSSQKTVLDLSEMEVYKMSNFY